MAVRIGYMGIPNSNSEEAAECFAQRHGWGNCILVPLVSSASVIRALDEGSIDRGVVAVANRYVGTVGETATALRNRRDIRVEDELWLPIHHCIYSFDGGPIHSVASHPQALSQSAGSIARLLPGAMLVEVEDTALAAEYLAKGKLPHDCAVVCRRNAGEHYGLHLEHLNVEDRDDNMTSFDLLVLDRPL
jgi:prephenate dehydratase